MNKITDMVIGATLALAVICLAKPQGHIQIFGKEINFSVVDGQINDETSYDVYDYENGNWSSDYSYEYDYENNNSPALTEQDTNKEVR